MAACMSFAITSTRKYLLSPKKVCLTLNCKLETRCYSRRTWQRVPLKVTSPEETIPEDWPNFKKTTLSIQPTKLHQNLQDESQLNIEQDPSLDTPHYIRLGDKSSIFTQAMSIVKSRNQREKHKKIVLEGKRLIKDAINAGMVLETLFFSLEENIAGLPLNNIANIKLYKVMYKLLEVWSDLTTCPGVMGVFKMPEYKSFNSIEKSQLPLTIICDNIREPNNLGAIMRCVAAAGCQKILLAKGCVDLWEPKVLRSGAGAHFHIQVANNIEWAFMNNYIAEDADVYIADNCHFAEENEIDPSHSMLSEIEEDNSYELDEVGQKYKTSFLDKENLKIMKNISLPFIPYHEIRIDSSKETVLVIGGETHGLSAACKRFTLSKNGQKVVIPLFNNVESLNSSVAAGIIIFEILRQIKLSSCDE